jgi:NAD(P)-dependent dehydrogenase (short-subunit alcohol dehydrogenase family)
MTSHGVIPMSMLAGKVVLATGAASGIGRATAIQAARHGAEAVIVADVNEEGGAETVAAVEAAGVEGFFQPTDVSRPGDPDAAVAAAVERFGRLDCAVNNAGTRGEFEDIFDVTDENWDRVMSINLSGLFRCLRAELRQMKRQGKGSIVNIGSGTIFGVTTGLSPYVASKYGVMGLTRIAAREMGQHGVRVNCVCPGRTNTPMLRMHMSMPGFDPARQVEPIALRRLGEPEEQGEAILWLLSDLSSFVTGDIMVVDGGRTL